MGIRRATRKSDDAADTRIGPRELFFGYTGDSSARNGLASRRIRVHSAIVIGTLGALLIAGSVVWRQRPPAAPGDGAGEEITVAATYMGSTACATCHAAETEAWRRSHHSQAMAAASETSVLGEFDDTTFEYAGTRSTFLQRDDNRFVRTEGADAAVGDFEIKYTFGVYPLQQYLVEMAGGRLQALGVAWDARPEAVGGHRWFDLYPNQQIRPGSSLHWTGIDQNWNFMCADCHSTNVRKGYDASTRTFRTTSSEISVGCEACHGPGSAHVAAASKPRATRDDVIGFLTSRLDERRDVTWRVDATAWTPVRSTPRVSDREIEVCARCHARRSQMTDAVRPGDPFENAFRTGLLEPGLFFADGQQRGEVYTHGSFLQSKMYARGVTCSDCHDPHGGTLRFSGNAVCTQCHTPSRYDASAHHFHQPGTVASACVTCHMPARTYMGVDPRSDHSFRIPRPDRAVGLGTPDVCTTACHQQRDAAWAAAALARLRPLRTSGGFQTFAEAFHDSDRNAPGATAQLGALTADPALPPIVRASAFARMGSDPSLLILDNVVHGLRDPDPMVRRAAVGALRETDVTTRITLVPPLLIDPIRSVRIEAARSLADLPDDRLPATFRRAFDEYLAEQRFNADRPEAQVNLGTVFALRRQFAAAIDAFREAIRLDRTFTPASINMADLYRSRGDERATETVLREALAANPGAADAHHALGLALVRQKKTNEAMRELALAARLAPEVASYGYVYAVATHDVGRPVEAIALLRKTLAVHPYDRAVLMALAEYSAALGRRDDAAQYAERLLAWDPDDPAVRALLNRSSPAGDGQPRSR